MYEDVSTRLTTCGHTCHDLSTLQRRFKDRLRPTQSVTRRATMPKAVECVRDHAEDKAAADDRAEDKAAADDRAEDKAAVQV